MGRVQHGLSWTVSLDRWRWTPGHVPGLSGACRGEERGFWVRVSGSKSWCCHFVAPLGRLPCLSLGFLTSPPPLPDFRSRGPMENAESHIDAHAGFFHP